MFERQVGEGALLWQQRGVELLGHHRTRRGQSQWGAVECARACAIQAQILDLLNELKSRLGMAIMLITHAMGVVAETGTVPKLIAPAEGCRFAPRCRFASAACTAATPPLREVAPGHKVACILESSPT